MRGEPGPARSSLSTEPGSKRFGARLQVGIEAWISHITLYDMVYHVLFYSTCSFL